MTAPHRIDEATLLALRLHALGLTDDRAPAPGAASGAERIASVARRMLALQGQDWRASRWALGLRAPGATIDDVHAAFDAGLVVRSWPMRSTVHVVPAADIGWMQHATGERVLRGAARRREQLGLEDAMLDRLVEVSAAALAVGPLSRDGLAAAWNAAGIEWPSNWRYHVIWWLCQNGIAVFGPTAGTGEPLLVLAADWIREPRRLEGDDALAELAVRHAAGRGPVRVKDFAWWTGLTARDAKRGIALATDAGRLVQLRLDDSDGAAGDLWAPPELLEASLDGPVEAGRGGSLANRWRLLPAFDEHLLGYTLRDPQLAPGHLERVLPGRNGVFLPTVVHDGAVVGTWKRDRRAGVGFEVTPFPGVRIDPDAITDDARRWAEFHASPADVATAPRVTISP